MTTYGITPAGFVLKRYEDCRSELEATIREVFGNDVNLDTGSVFNQFLHIWALREADQWERMQAAYNATRPASAVGTALDDILELSGLTRFPATSSFVEIMMRGADQAVVPQYFSVSDENETAHWLLFQATTISASNALEALIHVDSVIAGNYSISLNGSGVIYTATGSETVDEIVANLANLIIGGGSGAGFTVTYDLDTDIISILAEDRKTPFTVALTGSMAFESIGTPGLFLCETVGPIPAPAGSMVKINTPDTPTSVINFFPATRGYLVETDTEARLRREVSYAGIAGATPTAIGTRIRGEVVGVSDCHVFVNDKDIEDADGRPPHSVEAVVSGGADQDVLNKLYEVLAGGPDTYGNVTGTVTTSLGQLKEMSFSRPLIIYVWVRYTLTYDPEVAFPVDGQAQIKAQLLAYGPSHFPLGRDLAIDKFKVPVHSVPGIRTVGVELAVTDVPSGSPIYVASDIVLNPTQLPEFDVARISFVGA